MPEEELGQAVAGRHEVLADILASPDEIPDGLLVRGGDADSGEFAGAIQARELGGVAPVGLDAVTGALGNQGRGDDVADDPHRRELPIELEPTGPRFGWWWTPPRLTRVHTKAAGRFILSRSYCGL
jgi:hypothetical protein